ncbi:hypothetical protein [Burkholderia phage BCSR5]|nr:hypothetical protein [Burkholderia phage BCSR5]
MKIEAAARLRASSELLAADGEKWSKKVKTKWEPPEGLFTESAEKIAQGLKRGHTDLQGAMGSLNYYINRAGKNLSDADKKRLEAVKPKLQKLYGEK